MMRPIVIAGNGPSLSKIDYSRLPKDFEVFRCNQFFLEQQYFLGKKIKGVFYNPFLLKQQYFTLHCLKERGEYEVEDVYCNISMGMWDRQTFDKKPRDWESELKYNYPLVKSTYPYLSAMKEFDALFKFYALYYEKRFTSGIMMLITAIAQGYKEIYLTGIDFYVGGGVDYAFEVKGDTQLNRILPAFNDENFKDSVHNKDVDVSAIKLAQSLEGIKLYAISPDTPLCEILPLAPVQEGSDHFEVFSKPEGYICDLVSLPLEKLEEDRANSSRDSKDFLIGAFLNDFWRDR